MTRKRGRPPWTIAPQTRVSFMVAWKRMAKAVHARSIEKGFWEVDQTPWQILGQISDEVAEAVDAVGRDSSAIPGFSALEEEIADIVLRIMDYSARAGLDIPGAMLAKHVYNTKRPYLHGKGRPL